MSLSLASWETLSRIPFFSHLLFFCVCVCGERKDCFGNEWFDRRGWNVVMAWLGLLRLFLFFPLVSESGNLWHLVGISGLEIVLECLSIAREVLIASNVRYLVSLFFFFFYFIPYYEFLFYFFFPLDVQITHSVCFVKNCIYQ